MELIKIEKISFAYENEIKNTVNARDLHSLLQSKQDFSTWIKKRIEDYGFRENKDYLRFHKKMEANNATIIEYSLAIDMAKELCMIEKNDFGKQARQYFLECERKALEIKQPQTALEWAKAFIESETKRLNLENKVKQMEPAQKYIDELCEVGQLWSIGEVAKKLGIGQNKLFSKLRGMDILISTSSQFNLPYQRYINQGYFQVKEKKTGKIESPYYSQTYVTSKGVAWLHKIITGQLVIREVV